MMRLTLEGLTLETTEYAENGAIRFTVFTYGEAGCAALSDLLDSPERILTLRRGEERIPVRVSEHEIWPRCARRYGDAMQQHHVQLEFSKQPSVLALEEAHVVASLADRRLDRARL
jgi:hypothetical protein